MNVPNGQFITSDKYYWSQRKARSVYLYRKTRSLEEGAGLGYKL